MNKRIDESNSASGELTMLDGTKLTRAEQRRRARAWQMYDVANSAFQAVVVTFVFATYLASDLFLDPEVVALGAANPDNPAYRAAQAGSQQVISGLDLAAAIIVAVLAPALGRTSDRSGKRKRGLIMFSLVTIVAMFAMFFVFPGQQFLFFGALLLSIGIVFSELASVNYNAMLSQVASRDTIGRVSGTGWGLGYLSSIVLLLVVLMLFIQNFNGDAPGAGLLAVPDGADGQALNIRLTIVVSAIWFLLFMIPVMRRVPEAAPNLDEKQVSIVGAYAELWNTIKKLWRGDRQLLLFLLASAVFRDGLGAVFAWGAVLAAQVYGFSSSEVIYFAVAANLSAGIGTLLSGYLDDRFGPKPVIVGSLISLIAVGTVMMFTPNEPLYFWILALLLCLFVGPVQSASRSYLGRYTPEGRQGEIFGLYATSGRAAGWLSNLLYFLFISWLMEPKAGVWGIIIVFVVGLLLMLPVRAKREPVKL